MLSFYGGTRIQKILPPLRGKAGMGGLYEDEENKETHFLDLSRSSAPYYEQPIPRRGTAQRPYPAHRDRDAYGRNMEDWG
jgi:hypothetical protein